jgi:glycosyltransferase involved in cell wall biosynthesis
MKILFLARQLNIGGAERQLVTLANDLAARGHEIVIASYYPGGALSKKLDPRVRLLSMGKRSRWDLLYLYVRLIRVMWQERPDVLHGWMLTQNVIATPLRLFSPKVKLFWCVRSSNREMVLGRLEAFQEWLQFRIAGFADCIVVNSLAGLEHVVSRGIPREKMLHIPNGIDTNVFYPDAAERKAVRAEWGFSDSEKVIGKVARFDPIKNHPLFLKAAAKVSAERPEARFVCVGHGQAAYLEELRALTRTLGIESKVRWFQARPDTRAMYNALDVFCSSSMSEGFPNVIGEAMACGRRCVVTDAGDSGFVVGDTGVVVPSGDVEGLAAGLCRQLDAGDSLDLRSRQRILDNFTVARLGDKTEQALKRCLAESPTSAKRYRKIGSEEPVTARDPH